MKNFIGLLCSLLFLLPATAQTSITALYCENLSNPIGIDNPQPFLSWQLSSPKRNTMQTAYEIKVATSLAGLKNKKNIVWSSSKVSADASVYIPYAGTALASGKKYYWQVRVWDNWGKVSAWSAPAHWQMGLLSTSDWKASWITAAFPEDSIQRPAQLFRKTFPIRKPVQSATAYITAHGIYEASINGKRVGDLYLTPGWTSYNKRLQYQVFDVTSSLQQGENAVGVMLGNGWYRGFLAWSDNKNIYGSKLKVLLQLQITYTDGTTEWQYTDENWKSTTAPVTYTEIYHGERFDGRIEKTGWDKPGFTDTNWSGVQVTHDKKDILLATYNEGMRKKETFAPLQLFKTPKGELVADFGQNLVGWVQVKLRGKAGDSIVVHHAEVLDKAGNFYTDNLRAAKQQNTYILKGTGEEIFEPKFTFQGFRYIRLEGYTGELTPDNFTAIAVYSDMRPTGTFSSSNKLINQLQHNIQWGQKGNFLDVPTDCPQRDERLGWTGDAQVFSRTASFNMHVNNFFSKWMKDVAADQLPNGSVPFVVPNVLGTGSTGSAGWADAATIIPWDMYIAYGNKKILVEQYSSMKAWVEFMRNNSTDYLWNKGFHFGDWLFYRPDDDTDGRSALTDKYLIAQCFFAHSTQLLINTAEVLGRQEDVTTYTALLKNIKAAFEKEYLTPNGRLVSGSQTAYVLALHFDMLPEALRAQAAQRLVNNIKDYNTHLTTGFLGTPYLCHVLTRFGYADVAYNLLLQETYPSWLYPVKQGATTIWERWDGQKPDGSFQTPGMNSFNHYAYGAIGDWMYRTITGIDTKRELPGYKGITIRPHIGGGLTTAAASLDTYYGTITSEWKIVDKQKLFTIAIPVNTKATLYLPATNAAAIKENGVSLSDSKDITVIGKEGNAIALSVGSGTYQFTVEE